LITIKYSRCGYPTKNGKLDRSIEGDEKCDVGRNLCQIMDP
jgi:hypothetical protein